LPSNYFVVIFNANFGGFLLFGVLGVLDDSAIVGLLFFTAPGLAASVHKLAALTLMHVDHCCSPGGTQNAHFVTAMEIHFFN